MTLTHLSIQRGDLNAAEDAWQRILIEPSPFLNWVDYSYPVKLVTSALALAKYEYERMVAEMTKLLAEAQRKGLHTFMPEGYFYKGLALIQLGDLNQAQQALAMAQHEAEVIGERRLHWRILLASSKLESDKGKAQSKRQKAREIVEYIVEHTPKTELKNMFLSLRSVKELYEPAHLD